MRRLLAIVLIASSGCAIDTRSTAPLLPKSGVVSAFAPLSAGGLRYNELRTGKVREMSSKGVLFPEPVATLEVSTTGQRGLLGLAVDAKGRTFASWTAPDQILYVAQVAPGRHRIIWKGPQTPDTAIGGRIATLPNGNLLIGIGDLLQPDAVDDPATPNGKMLELDPDGPQSQTPKVLSSGWHNPFAFAVAPSGEVWVADNAPGDAPERLADLKRDRVLNLPADTVPSGLVAVTDDVLVLCGFHSRVVQTYRVSKSGLPTVDGKPRARDCSYGVTVLSDGRLIYASGNELRTVRL